MSGLNPGVTETESCRNCHFLQPDYCTNGGYCHRRAPIIVQIENGNLMTMWPKVGPDDWCGEFEQAVKVNNVQNQEGEKNEKIS